MTAELEKGEIPRHLPNKSLCASSDVDEEQLQPHQLAPRATFTTVVT
jgi:hypothetical protein